MHASIPSLTRVPEVDGPANESWQKHAARPMRSRGARANESLLLFPHQNLRSRAVVFHQRGSRQDTFDLYEEWLVGDGPVNLVGEGKSKAGLLPRRCWRGSWGREEGVHVVRTRENMESHRVFDHAFIAPAHIAKAIYQGLRYKPRYSDQGVSSTEPEFSWMRMREGLYAANRCPCTCCTLHLPNWSLGFWIVNAI